MKYNLTCKYANGGHSITEEWNDVDFDGLRKSLVEYLDILNHDGFPYKPEFDEVQKSLKTYLDADDDFIKKEYDRLTNGYNAYVDVMHKLQCLTAKLENDPSIAYEGSTHVIVDENTTVSIAVKRCKTL